MNLLFLEGNKKLRKFSMQFVFFLYRCAKWIINSRRADLKKTPEQLYKGYRMCAKHFEDSQFMNRLARNRLVWNAVPTLLDVPNPPKLITSSRKPPAKRHPPTSEQDPSANQPEPATDHVNLPTAQQSPTLNPAPSTSSATSAGRASRSERSFSATIVTPGRMVPSIPTRGRQPGWRRRERSRPRSSRAGNRRARSSSPAGTPRNMAWSARSSGARTGPKSCRSTPSPI